MTQSFNIANIMLGRGLGGIEQAMVDYGEALTSAGHTVLHVIHPAAAIRQKLEAQNMLFYPLANLGAWDIAAAWRLRRLLARLRTDIGIAHGNRALSLLALAAGKTKIVTVMHNYKIKCLKADTVLCPTRSLMEHAYAQGVASDRLHLIPNMVRMAEHDRRLFYPAIPVIGAMGRFVAKKGFDVFIEALALLKSRGVAFQAMLAGDGEEKEALKVLATQRGLEGCLSFPGWVENKSVFFGNVSLFCLPSRHEPFGIVLLEAMAHGLPVIATRSEGPSEIIVNGQNGLLVPVSDAAALADALERLIKEKDTAAMLAQNAMDEIKNRYALPVVSRKLDLALQAL